MKYTSVATLLTVIITIGVKGASEKQSLNHWWTKFSTSYPKYNETTRIIQEMEKIFPKIVKIYSIGKSVNGLELWVLNIAENVNKQRPLLRPMVKIVANMHGDETVGRSLVLM